MKHGSTGTAPVKTSTTPRFETRTEVDSHTVGHSDYVVADFNGDQQPDMLVASISGEVQVLLGSNGTWAQGQQLTLSGSPVWLASGDVDHDLDRDVVVVRGDAGLATVLLNDGSGNFTIGNSVPAGLDPLAVALGDANDDGHLDILVTRPQAPEVALFVGDGAGGFVPGTAINLPGGGKPMTIAVGDVTGDANPDLVVADVDGDRVLVYPGSGTATLDFATLPTELQIQGGPCACSIGDLNSDGHPDLAVSAYNWSQMVVVTQFPPVPGAQTFTSTTIPVDGAPSLHVIGDINGDGRNDLVTCLATRASVAVIEQRADGTLATPYQLDASGLPVHPALADANLDGRQDLFALSGYGDKINLWFASATGSLTGSRNYDSGLTYANYVASADFDGDGKADAALGGNFGSRVTILSSNAQGGMQLATSLDLGVSVFNVRAVDIDRDGDMDLVVPVENGVKVLRNNHNSYTSGMAFDVLPGPGAQSFGTGSGPFGVTAVDLDRDGNEDLALVDYAEGVLQILRGTGNCNFLNATQTFTLGGGPVDVVAADFTGDGKPDLAVSREHLADILVLANNGQGGLSVLMSLPVGAAPNYLFTADFDRDNRADIIASNGDSGTITVLFGGAGGFSSASYPAGRSPTALAAQDLTNDGKADILVASLEDGNYRILVNDGKGNFPNVFPFPGTFGATSGVLGDVDGDRDLDLLITSVISNRLSVVKNVSK